jgi:hypothetical protein
MCRAAHRHLGRRIPDFSGSAGDVGDGPPALPHLQDQGVRGHERIRAGVQWPVPEVGDLPVEVAGHLTDLRLTQPCDLLSRVIPNDSTSRSIRRVLTPSR